ncbi:hypothetical protein EXS70_03105 [Candidatus Peribacteria bacterium]|nr:hypothetical protein [Candidatus Peribacteria bacterium]
MRRFASALTVFTLLLPVSVSAYGKRRIGATTAMTRGSTTGVFIDRQVWLPGSWTVNQGIDKLSFRKVADDGIHESIVRIDMIPRESCGYGWIRIRALKAWGGKTLEQSQGRIEPVSFGTTKFKGYSWMEPSAWGGDRHWCVGQDLKNAMEMTAPAGDVALIKFIKDDLLLQLATRSGRSVLPWPAASEHSSSSQ